MLKLIHADFARLKHCKSFWVSLALLFWISIRSVRYYFSDDPHVLTGVDPFADILSVVPIMLIPYLSAILCSRFIGKDISSGVVKNKIIVGAKRRDIYLSQLTVCVAGSLILLAAYVLFSALLMLIFGFHTNLSALEIFTNLLCPCGTIISYSAIFTFISMLIKRKSMTSVICVILVLVIMIVGLWVSIALEEPEFESPMAESSDFVPGPNPYYIRGAKRVVYKLLADYLPFSQALQTLRVIYISSVSESVPFLLTFLRSLVTTAVVTAVGIFIFKHKNIF